MNAETDLLCAVEEAWVAYQAQAVRAVEDRKLLVDRGFMEELARREYRFKRLFLAQEGMA